MERINIENLYNNQLVTISDNGSFAVNKNQLEILKTIVIKKGINCDFLFGEISSNLDMEIIVEDDAIFSAKGIFNGESINIKINSKNGKNSTISMNFIDFSTGNCSILVNGDMIENGASYNWNMASLATQKDNKIVKVNVEHIGLNLYGDVTNYGVCKDHGKLEISGTTHIAKGSKNTITKQNARIMLIDEYSRGIAKPILKIDENDVKANHGASLGQLNEEHLFYLKSRGLSEAEAKRLIILGYFNPIVFLFKDEELEQYILDLIQERV